jgi:hypothetical protein
VARIRIRFQLKIIKTKGMKIRIPILCIIFCYLALSLSAQDDTKRYHIYGSGYRNTLSIYAGPMVTFSNVEGSFSVDLGATGGFIINKKFIIGAYGSNLMSNPPRSDLSIIGYPTYTDGKIKMMQAGGVLGYIHKPDNEFHCGVSCSGGLGILSLYASNPTTQSTELLYDDRVYILIPKLFVELNMTSWFKVNAGAGYRFFGRINGAYTNSSGEVIPTFNKSDYNKPELSISLLFGRFGFHTGLLH